MYRSFLHILFILIVLDCYALKKIGPLRMELLLEQEGIEPGSDFWVGWRIIREKGWHTYWEHPGDVGVPPLLDWNLPKDFSAGEILYALPEKVKMGTIRANGNYGETFFLIKIKAPDSLKIGDIVEINAKASWLTCSQQCLPGFTDLSLSVEVVEFAEINSDLNNRFEKIRANIPRFLEGSWGISARQDDKYIHLSFQHPSLSGEETDRPVFYCSNRFVRSDGMQFLTKKKGVFSLRMERSEWANKDENFLTGLIYRKSGWGFKGESLYAKIKVPLN